MNRIEEMKAKNYKLKSAKVNFIVHWTKEETSREVRVVLPELILERNHSDPLMQ